MESQSAPNKIEAIYDLREAVETKVHAEHALTEEPSPEKRDALLDAQLEVEAKTLRAIEVCHECGHAHEARESHYDASRVQERHGNVIDVDFSPEHDSEPPAPETPA